MINLNNWLFNLINNFTFYGSAGGAGGGGFGGNAGGGAGGGGFGGGAMGGAMRNFNPINVRGLNQNFGGMGRPMPQVSPPQGGFPQNPMFGGMGRPPMQGMGYPAQTQGMPPMSSGGGYPVMQPQVMPANMVPKMTPEMIQQKAAQYGSQQISPMQPQSSQLPNYGAAFGGQDPTYGAAIHSAMNPQQVQAAIDEAKARQGMPQQPLQAVQAVAQYQPQGMQAPKGLM